MQLFITSPDPKACAHVLDDKRVNNQIRETAQLLCTALRLRGCEAGYLMQMTHPNHPVTRWVSTSLENWLWTYEHFCALGREKLVRWPNNPPHKNWVELRDKLCPLAFRLYDVEARTPFVNCAARSDLNIDFTNEPNVYFAYEKYLCARWALEQPKWSNCNEPVFYVYA